MLISWMKYPLLLLGQATWNNDDIKKRCMVQNAQNIGMVDTVFEALVNDKSFSQTCNFLWSHAIRHDQQAKEKNERQIHTTCQPTGATKKDKVKTVLVLINELQLQDSAGSDVEVGISASS
jgi:adenylosuccinate synthase